MDRHDWSPNSDRRQPVVSLDAACRRCAAPVSTLPTGQVRILCYPRGYNTTGRVRHMRVFLCPHCHVDVWQWISAQEALRLFAAGVGVRRYQPSRDGPLTEDELIDFGRSLARRSDIARLALES